MRTVLLAFVAMSVAVAPQEAAVQTPTSPREADLYAALLDIGFDADAARQVDNVELTRGPATFAVQSGTWIPLQEVAGVVTGGVFLGSGTVLYSPPSGVEQDQLEKFTDERSLEEEFEGLYLRFSDATAAALAGDGTTVADESPTRTSVLVRAADRGLLEDAAELHAAVREHFLEEESVNIEARLLAELVDGKQSFFTAWIDTRDDGPLNFTQDVEARDYFALRGWVDRYDVFDQWGGFGGTQEAAARPLHYSLDINLDGDDLEESRATLRFVATRATRVLRFEADPLVEVHQVLDAAGEPLLFVREESKDTYEGMITVVFPQALAPGGESTVTFVYEGDIIDTMTGGGEYALKVTIGWYPMIGYMQRATYDMTFRVDKGDEVFASARKISDEIEDDRRVVRFEQDLPVAFVSFNYGSMETRVIEMEGAPPITVFGRAIRGVGGDALGNVGADVGNSLRYFSLLYGDYPFDYMSATRIPFPHGQGFPGLLHLAAGTFGSEVPGHSEAFRGHETAHQWWGHIVGWKSYRDQWISEGFAEYSGALYAEVYRDDPEILDKMTEAWRNDVFKIGNAGFRSFGMASDVMQRHSEGSWSGPITLGTRLSSSETPADYAMLAYEKGAYVLHMLRMGMYDWAERSDEGWRVMMRDFVAGHAGGEATTESFRAVVEKHVGKDMGWFFEQWVYGTAVPTYRYAWKLETAIDGQRSLRVRVRQSVEPDVPFRMFVPIRVDLDDERYAVLRVLVDEAYEEFSFNLPGGMDPQDVVLNPRNAVLARVEEERW